MINVYGYTVSQIQEAINNNLKLIYVRRI